MNRAGTSRTVVYILGQLANLAQLSSLGQPHSTIWCVALLEPMSHMGMCIRDVLGKHG